MGDRANVVLRYEDDKRIYLYTHWGGTALFETLQMALKRGKFRWSDPSYLGRIIFSEMIQYEVLEETGYGIAPYPTDNEWPFLVVDLEKQEVRVENDDREHFGCEGPAGRWSFDDFIHLTTDPRNYTDLQQIAKDAAAKRALDAFKMEARMRAKVRRFRQPSTASKIRWINARIAELSPRKPKKARRKK